MPKPAGSENWTQAQWKKWAADVAKQQKKLLSNIQGKDAAVRRKAARAGVTKAARLVVREAKKLSNKRTGGLKKSFAQKIRTYAKTNNITAIIGADGQRAPHAWLLEQGTSGRWTSNGKYRGRGPGFRMLFRAMRSRETLALAAINDDLRKAINQIVST